MNLNQYTDKIINILKKTPVDKHHAIWDIFINDIEIKKNSDLNKAHLKLLDTVFLTDIQKMKQKDIIDLWEYTEDCDIHNSLYIHETPEYDGNIVSDIKNEMIQLIVCDIIQLH